MTRYSQTTAPGQPVYRGERRLIVPTPEIPDPSAADPRKLVRHILLSRQGRSDPLALRAMRGEDPDETLGVHWSVDNKVIPQSFTEINEGFQTGVPMSPDESRGIKLSDLRQSADMRTLAGSPSPFSMTGRVLNTEPDYDNAMYRDLSGRGQAASGEASEGAAKPFRAQIMWEGRHNPAGIGEDDEISTDFERELTYERGTPMEITGARVLRIAKPGEEFANPYNSREIWNRVQFDQPIRALIGGRRSISNQIAERID